MFVLFATLAKPTSLNFSIMVKFTVPLTRTVRTIQISSLGPKEHANLYLTNTPHTKPAQASFKPLALVSHFPDHVYLSRWSRALILFCNDAFYLLEKQLVAHQKKKPMRRDFYVCVLT